MPRDSWGSQGRLKWQGVPGGQKEFEGVPRGLRGVSDSFVGYQEVSEALQGFSGAFQGDPASLGGTRKAKERFREVLGGL